ncbi:hypothetical protein ACFP81_08585 [Deinococcus lacus]|uniref:DUF2975 domain-containing protein n=1 Tax=Deinococcus lacus TaxID=392561 RepID=A0ABW1YCN4_9DEIO
MTTITKPKGLSRRSAALIAPYLTSLVLLAASGILEQAFHIWSRVERAGPATGPELIWQVASLLVLFLLAIAFFIYGIQQFRVAGYPVAGRGDMEGLDERQRLRFLEAQAKTQRFYILLASLFAFWMVYAGREGFSWFFGILLGSFICVLVSGWPTVMLIQDEPDLEDDQ